MDFARPALLYGLLGLIPFVVLVVWDITRILKGRKAFLSDRAYAMLGRRRSHDVEVTRGILMTLILGLLILALAGPRWGEAYEESDVKGIQLLFLLDTSASMMAEDIKPSRLAMAKKVVVNILDRLQTDMVSLATFAGQSTIVCPLTLDYEAFKIMVETTEVSPGEEQGTDFGVALSKAREVFQHAKGGGRLLVMISDGEDNERKWEGTIDRLKRDGINLITIGVGTTEGAQIPQGMEPDGRQLWKRDAYGQTVRTRLEEESLKRLAQMANGVYISLKTGNPEEILLDKIKGVERRILGQQMNLRRIPRFQYPLALALILLMVELLLTRRKIQWRASTV